jgi:hypothetical protein
MEISGRQGNDVDRRVWNTNTAAVWLESITERDHLEDRKLDGTKKTKITKYVTDITNTS